MKILNLGCGGSKFPNAIGVDINSNSAADVIHDLNEFPWPFKNNEFDVVYAFHIIEHLDDYMKALEEIHRIVKPNGKIIIKVPHFSSAAMYGQPDHKHFFTCKLFEVHIDKTIFKLEKLELRYLLSTNRKKNAFEKFLNKWLTFLANLNIHLCERGWCYLVGGFSECYAEFKAIKS